MRATEGTYNVTGDDFTSENGNLGTIANDGRPHGDITLERSDDIGSLLFLIPADESVEKKDTADNTEIDPVLKTGSQDSSNFHN